MDDNLLDSEAVLRLTRREMTVGDACSLTFLLLMADAVVLVEQIGQMVSKLIGRVPATGTASIYEFQRVA